MRVSVHVCAGELEMWNKAEAALEEALNASGREWVLNPADGAFYGPKIDITGRCGWGLVSLLMQMTAGAAGVAPGFLGLLQLQPASYSGVKAHDWHTGCALH